MLISDTRLYEGYRKIGVILSGVQWSRRIILLSKMGSFFETLCLLRMTQKFYLPRVIRAVIRFSKNGFSPGRPLREWRAR